MCVITCVYMYIHMCLMVGLSEAEMGKGGETEVRWRVRCGCWVEYILCVVYVCIQDAYVC